MKRSHDFSIDEDEDLIPARPAKRFSMMDNTPQQWKEERRHILRLSKQKLRKLDNPLRNLQKSVLINNTTKRMKRELEENGGSKYRGYKRNHASVPYQRSSLYRKVSSWEREVLCKPISSLQKSENAPVEQVTCEAKCDNIRESNDSDSRASDFSAIQETVLNHMMDTCTTDSSSESNSSNSCDSQDSCDNSSVCDSQITVDKNRNFLNQVPDNTSENCANAPSCEFSGENSSRNEPDYTGCSTSKIALSTDSQSFHNECNYTASQSQSHQSVNMDISSGLHSHKYVNSDTQSSFTNNGDFYAAYGLLYKQYCAYPGYLHSLHNPFGLHNQFTFTLEELMHNNNFGSSQFDFAPREQTNSCHTLNSHCSSFSSQEVSENDEIYVDVLT